MNFLVETKKEYTIQLINILSPHIYEGVGSIYNQAKKISKSDNVLKNFQTFLSKIPKWDNESINIETERIKRKIKVSISIEDLLKATIKSNIIILTHIPFSQNNPEINSNFYDNIQISDLIHKIYIETARELWNNPYLFYHNYPHFELKKNQRDSMILIKKSIEEAIRKIIPLNFVLKEYLGNDISKKVNKIKNTITPAEEENINNLLSKDLNFNNKYFINNNELNEYNKTLDDNKNLNNLNNTQNNTLNNTQNNTQNNTLNNTQNNNIKSNDNNIENKILDILDKNDIKLTDSKNSKYRSESSLIANINDNSIKKSIKSENNEIDSKIKKILEKDLKDTEIDTTVTYKAEDDTDDYQEVFSNSKTKTNTKEVFANSTDSEESLKNTVDKENFIKKKKFFNNYLNLLLKFN